MRTNAYVAGVGMTRFGKFLGRGLKSLAAETINEALKDAGLQASDLQAAYMGNGAAGVTTGQLLISGEAVLRGMGIGRIPVVNVENAGATSATAFQQAAQMITLGAYDVVLVCGFEKLHHEDKRKTFAVFQGAVDLEAIDEVMADLERNRRATGASPDLGGADSKRSLFMDIHASMARSYMQRSGATARHFAMVSAKNSLHGSLNPKVQYQQRISVDEVLAAQMISDPLTLPMCAPIGDGAAALVLVSARKAKQLGLQHCVRVLSSVLASGFEYDDGEHSMPEYAARLAYDAAGVAPEDLDVVELHDGSAAAELISYEHLLLAAENEGPGLLESGATTLGGRIPVNPSGGLLRKGHPIGASGAGQIVELVDQLRGRCGARQVECGRIALAENGGGFIGREAAAIVISILQKE